MMATFEKGSFSFNFFKIVTLMIDARFLSMFYNYAKVLIDFFLRILVWFEMLSRPEACVNMLIMFKIIMIIMKL